MTTYINKMTSESFTQYTITTTNEQHLEYETLLIRSTVQNERAEQNINNNKQLGEETHQHPLERLPYTAPRRI